MRIGQTSFVVFASKFLSSALGFVGTLIFARILGAEVLGYYALVLVVAKWLRLGGEIGVASAVTKRISEGEDQAEFFTAGMVIVGVLGVVCSIGVLVFRDFVNWYVGTEAAYFVVLLVVTGLPASLISSALNGARLVHVAGLLGPVRVGTRSLIQIVLVFAGFGLAGMLAGVAAGMVLVTAIGIAVLSFGFRYPRVEHFRSLFDFAKFSWLGNLRTRSFTDVDFLVLGAFVSPGLVGVYQIAWNVTNFVGVFGSSIRQTTFPELSRADAENREELFSTVVTDSIANNGLFAIPGLFGSLVIGDRLLQVYGEEFARGEAVLGLLIVAMLVYDYQNQLLNGLNALDRPELSFRANAAFIVTNVTLNVVLVYLVGWEGAAVATGLSAALGLALAFGYLRSILSFEVPIAEIGRQTAAAVVMSGVVWSARNTLEKLDIVANNVVVRAIEPVTANEVIVVPLVGLGVVVYFGVLLVISERFRSTVADNSPVPIPFLT